MLGPRHGQRVPERFPGALLAFDAYARRVRAFHNLSAARHQMAPLRWGCEDPAALEPLGLRCVTAASAPRPPDAVRATLPASYRLLLTLTRPLLGGRGAGLYLLRAS
jgi:hypothetical protein